MLRASGDWLTYSEIASTIVKKHNLKQTDKQAKHFLQKLREATHALFGKGAVEPESALQVGQGETRQRWRLSHQMFRPR